MGVEDRSMRDTVRAIRLGIARRGKMCDDRRDIHGGGLRDMIGRYSKTGSPSSSDTPKT